MTNRSFADLWSKVSKTCKDRYDIDVGNNARFVAENIYERAPGRSSFTYAECGVYLGSTFLPVCHTCEALFDRFHLYALDSFAGFPEVAAHEMDDPDRFEMLFSSGRITAEHRDAAAERCARLDAPDQHLQTSYFRDYVEVFDERIRDKPNITKVPCSFHQLDESFGEGNDHYDLVFLDCDLYTSYWDCLRFFQDKTDLFIFDEYYSLKYPGARIACDEFMDQNEGWRLFSKTEQEPYFERWGMAKD